MEKKTKGRNGGTLTPWQRGQSGNPQGRPKGALGIKTIVSKILEKEMTLDSFDGRKKKMIIEHLVYAQVCKALTGDTKAFNSLLNQAYGKPSTVAQDYPENGIVFVEFNKASR